MALVTIPGQNRNDFVFARSDGEFEQHVREAIEASNDDYAFRIQLEESLLFYNYTSALDVQVAEIIGEGGESSSSSEKASKCVEAVEADLGFLPGSKSGGGEVRSGKEVEGHSALEWQECPNTVGTSTSVPVPVPAELCGICFEDSMEEMFEGLHCLHRFCHACMTRYIHSRLEQKRHQMCCPHSSCSEPLTLQECRYFLPAEIFDAWSSAILEAEIPDSDKLHCPFPDCLALLLLPSASEVEIPNAECPFCNRMFCVRCMVPWHADLHCDEFQKLPPTERSEADLQLLKLADDLKWQRCAKCKGMIELSYGCNHMTCRCGYEFCYECGTGWKNGGPNCRCPRTNENRLLQSR
uniref:RBR-type E3 ubiquitin transferase n=1 Tax=Wollemia nobilis TaxID=56998 RepID=A0A0C9S4W7_9CONI